MAGELLHNVQVARFVAAAAILVTHTADLIVPHSSPLFAVHWTAGVDIFFIISGFIMTYLTHDRFGRAEMSRDFLIRRLIRIVPSYWIFTALMAATAIVLDAQVKYTTVTPVHLVTSFGFIPWPRGDGQLNPLLSQGWTLNYEMFFYLAFAAALLLRRGLAILAAAFIVLSALHPWIPDSLFMLRFWSAPIILEFVAGIALARIYLSGCRLRPVHSLLLAALGAALLVVPPIADLGGYNRAFWFGVPALLVCSALILLPDPSEMGALGRLLRAGGDGSYALYLSHTFTVNAVVLVWAKAGLGLPWLAMTVAMTLAIAAAILFYYLIERPLTDFLQRRAGTRPVIGAATVAP